MTEHPPTTDLEGYWERAYWDIVPKLQAALALTPAGPEEPREGLDALWRLSEAATPGPWIRRWASLDVHHMTGDDALQAQADIDFAVAACSYVRHVLESRDWPDSGLDEFGNPAGFLALTPAGPEEPREGHKPLPDGRCEHRWRNRQTKAVQCSFADGWNAALTAKGLDAQAEALLGALYARNVHSAGDLERHEDVRLTAMTAARDAAVVEADNLRAATPAPDSGAERDVAYRERNAVVAALIRSNGWPRWVAMAPDADGWVIVYAETPQGQVSWHVGPDDFDLFADFPSVAPGGWDGHTTEEKYARLAALSALTPAGPEEPREPTDAEVHANVGRVARSEWTPDVIDTPEQRVRNLVHLASIGALDHDEVADRILAATPAPDSGAEREPRRPQGPNPTRWPSPARNPERFDRSWWHYADDCPSPPVGPDSGAEERLRAALEAEKPRLAAMRTWPRGSNGSVAIAAYEGLVWRLWGLLTKGTPEPDDERVMEIGG
jgi:hypothetical protein